jgi:hypothetical protein
MKDLKIRASQLGKLMATDSKTSITQKQLVTLNGLLAKIKLTEKQAELRDTLLLKRDAEPELSKGAKSYITELYLEREFGIKQEINSKYLDKGNEVENASIELTSILLEKDFLFKNDEYFENDFIHGTPDVLTGDSVIDVKSSWSAATFPFFDTDLKNSLYEWQLKAYMWLTGRTKSFLCYCLVPTPQNLILDEMRRVSWKRGEGAEVSRETEDEVIKYFDISKIPTEKRIKAFQVDLTVEDIQKMKVAVRMARKFYETLS